jgi:UV DNA damage endonuclease
VKIGYPTIAYALGCTPSHTFRLASYSDDRMAQTITQNVDCLEETIAYNVAYDLLFFRISSSLIPFASHPICTFDWRSAFGERLEAIGTTIRQYDMRISLHPGQYTLLNSPKEDTYHSSVAELVYHEQLLNALGLDHTHKIQIHVGGVYGNKAGSMARFVERYAALPEGVKARLVIENDERQYSVRDCLRLYEAVGTPVIIDNLHHALNSEGASFGAMFHAAADTWAGQGAPMVDYSSQAAGARIGTHAETLDEAEFADFLAQLGGTDCDVMLEIKDKEVSALKALRVVRQ